MGMIDGNLVEALDTEAFSQAHLWVLHSETFADVPNVLNLDEGEEAATLRSRRLRRSFEVSRSMQRLLGEVYAPPGPGSTRSRAKRPTANTSTQPPRWPCSSHHYSVAHTTSHWVCVVVQRPNVPGVDLEEYSRFSQAHPGFVASLAGRLGHGTQQGELETRATRNWVRLEAQYKWRAGSGIAETFPYLDPGNGFSDTSRRRIKGGAFIGIDWPLGHYMGLMLSSAVARIRVFEAGTSSSSNLQEVGDFFGMPIRRNHGVEDMLNARILHEEA